MRPLAVHQAASVWDSKAFRQARFQATCAMQRLKQFAYLTPHIRIRKAGQYSYFLLLRQVFVIPMLTLPIYSASLKRLEMYFDMQIADPGYRLKLRAAPLEGASG